MLVTSNEEIRDSKRVDISLKDSNILIKKLVELWKIKQWNKKVNRFGYV